MARVDPDRSIDDDWERLLSEPGWTRGVGDIRDIKLDPIDPDDPYAATRILEELREERLP